MGFNDLRKRQSGSSATDGGSIVTITSPLSSFGELQVVNLTPVAQGDFVYTANPKVFRTRQFGGGTLTVTDGMAHLESGINPSGSAIVQTRRGLKYRPGQGSLMRGTALFGEPSSGNAQFIGCGNSESGYFVGYFGEYFGILHNQKASREIRTFTVTTGVPTTNVTVTLNGVSIIVPVTGNNDLTQTAYELSKADYSSIDGGWLTDVIENTVYFISTRTGPPSSFNGTYSIVGGAMAGNFAQLQAAEVATQDFIPSGSFNVDTLDGSGPSGMVLNPQRGNVYQIGFQYLGFGNAHFGVEDPVTGRFFDFHRIQNSNNRTFPVLKNPNVSILATSANIGGSESVTLKTSSLAGYVEGKVVDLDPTFSETFSFTTNSTSYVVAAIIKVDRVFQGKSCFGEIDLLKISGANNSGGTTLTIGAFLDEKLFNQDVDFKKFETATSIVSIAVGSPTGNVFSTFTPTTSAIYTMTVGSNSARTEEFADSRFPIISGEQLFIAVKSSNGNLDGQVTINWYEQQ